MEIKIENLSKEFKENLVLDNINLAFRSGKIYGVVGNNGSGKTMLLRAVAGLILPTTGEIMIDNKLLHRDISFPERMGVLIEKPELLNYLTGFENLKFLASVKELISEEDIKEYMRKFSLDPLSKKIVKKYSLGMKQKLGIIQAIMEDQELLVLDEPFNALDENTVKNLRTLLLEYKEMGKLIIITSHHEEDIDLLCDEIIYLTDGRVKKIDKRQNIF